MIYISIGSNLGDRLGYIHRALDLLQRYITDLRCSIILETEALTPEGASASWNKPFLNAICYGHCSLSPEDLLVALKQIEHELGRPIVYEKWSPRVVDLDILLWDDLTLNSSALVVPHPELCNRPFLLHLMSMLAPTLKHPMNGKAFAELSIAMPCSFIRSIVTYPRLVGVVNVTTNSFSDGGIYIEPDQAIEKALTLHAQGASVIDIGAQSTRPGVEIIDPELEYGKLKPVLDGLGGDVNISVDTFAPEVIRKILNNHKVAWINDQSGNMDDATLRLVAEQGCKIVTMHSLFLPARKNVIPEDKDIMSDVIKWASHRAEHLLTLGFKQDDIILDPGIGFSKSMYQDIGLLKQIGQLKKLGLQLLIGHSRKSYMQGFSNLAAKERDLETIAISALLAQAKVDFIRVHNVEDHQRFFTAQQAIAGGMDV